MGGLKLIILIYSKFILLASVAAAALVVLAYDLLVFPRRIKRLKELEDEVYRLVEAVK